MNKERFINAGKIILRAGAFTGALGFVAVGAIPVYAEEGSNQSATTKSQMPLSIEQQEELKTRAIKARNMAFGIEDQLQCKGGIVNATYYNLHGQRTASGEIMDRNAYTAAVPVPEYRRFGEELGDYVRITRIDTGSFAVVKLNDTGMMASPSYPDKYVDVTQGVAENMGWKIRGSVEVCFEKIN